MKPLASLSLDLDNEWSYLKTHGDPSWEQFPSYLERVVPRVLDFLAQRGLRISFFIVGKDAELPGHDRVLRPIAENGHEIGNHSFMHDPWLHRYTDEQLNGDLQRAEQAIERATGQRPRGFRGPGFSLSPSTLMVLARRGYRYDATVFPNLLNPLARAYFFSRSNLSREEREQRKALFGTWRDALRPVKPFRWQLEAMQMLEIPVTTMPLFKVPIHMSYIIYLGKYSRLLAKWYFRFALRLCRLTRTEPSILLHPLDFLGPSDAPKLAFFPGMDLPLQVKLEIVSSELAALARQFEIVTMEQHAARIEARGCERLLRPAEV